MFRSISLNERARLAAAKLSVLFYHSTLQTTEYLSWVAELRSSGNNETLECLEYYSNTFTKALLIPTTTIKGETAIKFPDANLLHKKKDAFSTMKEQFRLFVNTFIIGSCRSPQPYSRNLLPVVHRIYKNIFLLNYETLLQEPLFQLLDDYDILDNIKTNNSVNVLIGRIAILINKIITLYSELIILNKNLKALKCWKDAVSDLAENKFEKFNAILDSNGALDNALIGVDIDPLINVQALLISYLERKNIKSAQSSISSVSSLSLFTNHSIGQRIFTLAGMAYNNNEHEDAFKLYHEAAFEYSHMPALLQYSIMLVKGIGCISDPYSACHKLQKILISNCDKSMQYAVMTFLEQVYVELISENFVDSCYHRANTGVKIFAVLMLEISNQEPDYLHKLFNLMKANMLFYRLEKSYSGIDATTLNSEIFLKQALNCYNVACTYMSDHQESEDVHSDLMSRFASIITRTTCKYEHVWRTIDELNTQYPVLAADNSFASFRM